MPSMWVSSPVMLLVWSRRFDRVQLGGRKLCFRPCLKHAPQRSSVTILRDAQLSGVEENRKWEPLQAQPNNLVP
jgi:hypothetical protein